MRNYSLFLIFVTFSFLAFSQCSLYPTLNIGNDTLLCPGQSLTINVPLVYDNYQWSDGNLTNSNTFNNAGTYTLEVANVSNNLVANGDFESGNVGFSSSYIYGTGGAYGLLSNEGQYAIATSPNATHNNFSNCADHTPSGIGNMLVANGSGTPNTSVWCQTIPVVPNTNYLFSAWIMNALNDFNVSNLQFFVNGIQIGPVFSTSPTACIWQEFNDVWNSGASSSANICIYNQNTTVSGNDFAIDDISFKEVCLQTDEITLTYDPLVITIQEDLAFCENETDNFVVTSNQLGTAFIWENGVSGAQFTPTQSGTYSVFTTSANGCIVSDSAVATITPMPWYIDTIFVVPTNCGENNGAVSAQIVPFNLPALYTWNGPGEGNPNFINATAWTDLSPGIYYFSMEYNGCFLYDTAEVVPLNPPVAAFSANTTSGCSPLEVTFTNSSQNATNYAWNFGDGPSTNVTDLTSQTHVFTNSSTIQLIASQSNCADTTTISVSVNTCGCNDPNALNYNPLANVNDGSCLYPIPPTPTVETYNVFSPNGDEINEGFYFTTTNASSVEMTIINRWGNLIYQETSLNPIWNGKNTEGLLVEDGVYFYKYKVTGLDGTLLEGHGFVEVVK